MHKRTTLQQLKLSGKQVEDAPSRERWNFLGIISEIREVCFFLCATSVFLY